MKTEQELKELQKEYKELKEKLSELTEEELKQVCGGNGQQYEFNIYENTTKNDFKPNFNNGSGGAIYFEP